jgi:hypothetical protein
LITSIVHTVFNNTMKEEKDEGRNLEEGDHHFGENCC